MFKVKNLKTGKFIKNPIDGKVYEFETKEHADKFATGCTLNAMSKSMTNTPSSYMVVSA